MTSSPSLISKPMIAVAPTMQRIPPTSLREQNLWTDKILPTQNGQSIKKPTKGQLLRSQSLTEPSSRLSRLDLRETRKRSEEMSKNINTQKINGIRHLSKESDDSLDRGRRQLVGRMLNDTNTIESERACRENILRLLSNRLQLPENLQGR